MKFVGRLRRRRKRAPPPPSGDSRSNSSSSSSSSAIDGSSSSSDSSSSQHPPPSRGKIPVSAIPSGFIATASAAAATEEECSHGDSDVISAPPAGDQEEEGYSEEEGGGSTFCVELTAQDRGCLRLQCGGLIAGFPIVGSSSCNTKASWRELFLRGVRPGQSLLAVNGVSVAGIPPAITQRCLVENSSAGITSNVTLRDDRRERSLYLSTLAGCGGGGRRRRRGVVVRLLVGEEVVDFACGDGSMPAQWLVDKFNTRPLESPPGMPPPPQIVGLLLIDDDQVDNDGSNPDLHLDKALRQQLPLSGGILHVVVAICRDDRAHNDGESTCTASSSSSVSGIMDQLSKVTAVFAAQLDDLEDACKRTTASRPTTADEFVGQGGARADATSSSMTLEEQLSHLARGRERRWSDHNVEDGPKAGKSRSSPIAIVPSGDEPKHSSSPPPPPQQIPTNRPSPPRPHNGAAAIAVAVDDGGEAKGGDDSEDTCESSKQLSEAASGGQTHDHGGDSDSNQDDGGNEAQVVSNCDAARGVLLGEEVAVVRDLTFPVLVRTRGGREMTVACQPTATARVLFSDVTLADESAWRMYGRANFAERSLSDPKITGLYNTSTFRELDLDELAGRQIAPGDIIQARLEPPLVSTSPSSVDVLASTDFATTVAHAPPEAAPVSNFSTTASDHSHTDDDACMDSDSVVDWEEDVPPRAEGDGGIPMVEGLLAKLVANGATLSRNQVKQYNKLVREHRAVLAERKKRDRMLQRREQYRDRWHAKEARWQNSVERERAVADLVNIQRWQHTQEVIALADDIKRQEKDTRIARERAKEERFRRRYNERLGAEAVVLEQVSEDRALHRMRVLQRRDEKLLRDQRARELLLSGKAEDLNRIPGGEITSTQARHALRRQRARTRNVEQQRQKDANVQLWREASAAVAQLDRQLKQNRECDITPGPGEYLR